MLLDLKSLRKRKLPRKKYKYNIEVFRRANEAIKEGLGDLAHAAEKDHEVQMARAELYKLAKYAIKLHEKLKGVSEAEGLEGWVQAKITKSADMIGSVYHHLDYQEVDDEPMMDLELPGRLRRSKRRNVSRSMLRQACNRMFLRTRL